MPSRHDVDGLPDDLRRQLPDPHELQEPETVRFLVVEEIHVRVGIGLAAGYGAEQVNMRNALRAKSAWWASRVAMTVARSMPLH